MSLYLEILLLFPKSLKVTFSLNEECQHDSHIAVLESMKKKRCQCRRTFRGREFHQMNEKKMRGVKIEKVYLTFTGGIAKEYGKHPSGKSADFNNTCCKQFSKG